MKVGVVIVHYNKKDILRNCLKSIQQIDYKNFIVYVIDNGSTDGSVELVKKEFPSVSLENLGYNSGFCIANNRGIKSSLKDNCDGVLLLNNDTEVTPLFLNKMVQYLSLEKKIGMVAPKVLFINNRNIVDSAGLAITPDGLSKNRGLGEESAKWNKLVEVFCPAGAAALFSRELLEDIAQKGTYLDDDFGFYFEELDLGWRARLRGWKCVYVPEAVVYHHKSATVGAYSKFVAYYTNRNIFFNIIKNYPFLFMVRALFLSAVRYPLFLLGFILRKGPGYKIKKQVGIMGLMAVTVKGWVDFAIKLPSMLEKRRKIQKRKLVEDSEIKRWFKELGLSFFDSIYKL